MWQPRASRGHRWLWVPAGACHRAGIAGPVGRDDEAEQNRGLHAYRRSYLRGSAMSFPSAALVSIASCAAALVLSAALAQTALPAPPLKAPAEFASISNQAERSRAIFAEV